ncbi:MAG TPA: hypothetical protein VNX29_17580 [Kaistia sp.]|nr:hypothetical protein [Kaistia sp.]
MLELADPTRPAEALPQGLSRPVLEEALQVRFQGAMEAAAARFYAVRDAIGAVSQFALERHGLVGPELTFKLSAVSTASTRLFENPFPKWLKKLLEMIDTVFKSILEALKIDGALTELKEIVENLIEDD